MPATIPAVFEHGVIRPLSPVAFADNEPLEIVRGAASHESMDNRLIPSIYLDGSEQGPEESFDYQPPPHEVIGMVRPTMVAAGPLRPPVVPEE